MCDSCAILCRFVSFFSFSKPFRSDWIGPLFMLVAAVVNKCFCGVASAVEVDAVVNKSRDEAPKTRPFHSL